MAYNRENVFARILRGDLPAPWIYEDDEFIAIRDVAPMAPVHILVIPRGEPPVSLADVVEDDAPWLGRMIVVATRIARAEGLDEDGYRLVINCREHGGQSVPHLHLHLLGGRPLGGFA